MAMLGAKLDLALSKAKHNVEGDDFHFDIRIIIGIESQWSGGVTFTELSMPVQFKANGNCGYSRTVVLCSRGQSDCVWRQLTGQCV